MSSLQTVDDVMRRLETLGSPQTVKIYRNHGAKCEMFGCKVADLKIVAKEIRGRQELAMELYDTGNSDAMYLAGMVANGAAMNRRQLQAWAQGASWYMISEYTVPGVACEHAAAWEMGLKWIETKPEHIAACGWATLSGVVATREDAALDLDLIQQLLQRIASEIRMAKNRVRYNMNSFVIAVGAYVQPLLDDAKSIAKQIGKVEVDMGTTACKVPLATESIAKVEKMGRIGKKRKTMKC